MRWLSWFKECAEYLGGARDAAPAPIPLSPADWRWGLWWGVLTGLILLFCGQSSKFIYIDF